MPTQLTLPTENTEFDVVANAPQKTFRCGFESAVASGLDTEFFRAVVVGSGMGASQSAGSALLTSGTTTYAESIYRSNKTFSGNMTFRYRATFSQRIINQDFYIELVDSDGDGLPFVVNSTTSVTVTFPVAKFNATHVGQSIYIGAISLASCPSGRYAIASVSGNTVTFTVVGFPASGAGTCSLFGRNFYHLLYNGATATAVGFGTGRQGYANTDTTATINTTASPGHYATIAVRDATAAYLDQLSASSTAVENAVRAQTTSNIPEDGAVLYIQLRMVNGSVAPASTTTMTIGAIQVENFVSQQVTIVGIAPQGYNTTVPTSVINTVTTTDTGAAAHSAASSGNPVRVGGRVNTAIDTTLVQGDVSDLIMTSAGGALTKPYSIPELDWTATSALTPLATTTLTALKTAGAATVRNYVTGIQLYNSSATVSTNVAILDGSTVIWAGFLPATTAALPIIPVQVTFSTPLRGTAATAMNIQLGTTSASVYYNAQGYQAI